MGGSPASGGLPASRRHAVYAGHYMWVTCAARCSRSGASRRRWFRHLHRPAEGPAVIVLERLADTLEHEPGRLLRDADVPVQPPCRLVRWKQMAKAHFCRLTLDPSRIVPMRTEKCRLQSRQWQGRGSFPLFSVVSTDPQCGQWRPCGQILLSNHSRAASSVGNRCMSSTTVMPSRSDLPGAVAMPYPPRIVNMGIAGCADAAAVRRTVVL